MTLEECYGMMEGDYKGVMGRLMKEERIIRFLGKFREDNMLEPLETSIKKGVWEEAFWASHNLKGVCQNLGISKLADSSSVLCELIRNGAPTVDITPYMEKVREDYTQTLGALNQIL